MRESKRIEISPELIRLAQAGNQEAFTELYRRSGPTVYRTIYSMVQDENTAWDIHQNAFLLAWQGLAKLEKPEAFLPWLRRIAVREAIKELNKDQPLCFTELANAEEEEPQFEETRDGYQPELSLDRQEAARLVREILDQLPKKQRLIMGMYYYERLSIKEIAEALNVTQGTVKTQLHLGRKRVELSVKQLESEGVKLYGLSPMTFLVALLKRQSLPARNAEAALSEILAKVGGSAEAKAAASGASGVVAESVVLHAARPFYTTVIGKLVLGVVAVGVVVGVAAGYRWTKDKLIANRSYIPYVSTGEALPTFPVEIASNETTAPESSGVDAELATSLVEPAPNEPVFSELSGDDEHKAWGRCGENLTWTLNKDTGELIIEGSGAMDDFPGGLGEWIRKTAPWADYTDTVTAVRLPEELTYIGESAFLLCSNLTEVDPIPSNLTGIGAGAFRECERLKGLTLPDGLTSIGEEAFHDCTSLGYVTFPESLVSIGKGAFLECTSMTGIILPENLKVIEADAFCGSALRGYVSISASVEKIGPGAFSQCPLSGFDVASDNPCYSSLDGVLCNKAKSELIQYPARSLETSYSVPLGVTDIAPYAFEGCYLKSIILPVGLTGIGNGAFSNCRDLTSIKLPDGLASIGEAAFDNCSSLTSIKLPNGLASIGNYAFQSCTKLTSIKFSEGLIDIGFNAFDNCTSLRDVTLLEGLTGIGDYAFQGCTNLTSATLPASLTDIGEKVFSWCSNSFTIYGTAGSLAQTYAEENRIPFVAQ